MGTISDPSGAVIPDAEIEMTNKSTGEIRAAVVSSNGHYAAGLLPPGHYTVQAVRRDFKTAVYQDVQINVTETVRLDIRLTIGEVSDQVVNVGDTLLVETHSTSLGELVPEKTVITLPLVTRNYTQILGLSPGVTLDVTNAGELGRGSGGSEGGSPGAKHVNGAMQYDNNFQMNGIQVNDAFAAGVQFGGVDQSGGVPVPNPDTIQEFKVQTAQYDAQFGRNAGANVEIVTKGGSDQFHGTLFEFFRNESLNANDFFRKSVGQDRPTLRENQFGLTMGGPIKRGRLLFFSSYQRTQQKNGAAPQCSASLVLPPLTNERSAVALGRLFEGFHGALDSKETGVSILPDGSNINPVALQLLQMRSSTGEYFIPTPQSINAKLPFLQQGFSVFSQPCSFDEDQFMVNVDYLKSKKSTFQERFFFANGLQNTTFADSNIPTLPFPASSKYRDISVAHMFIINPELLNHATFGYNFTGVTEGSLNSPSLFSWSSVGVTVPSQDDGIPILSIPGSLSFGSTPPTDISQNSYNISDTLAWNHGAHEFRFGGSFAYNLVDLSRDRQFASLAFLSFPDFLLGLPGSPVASVGNGTPFSNVSSSLGFTLLFDRRFRARNASVYAQDDYRVTSRLTLNMGLRYEHIGDLVDRLGRISNFDMSSSDPNPDSTGSLRGFVVASNYSGGTLPDGVRTSGNEYGIEGDNQNVLAPRFGFAWDVSPRPGRLVARGGYGISYTQPPGLAFFFTSLSQPWSSNEVISGIFVPSISFQHPFIPPLPSPSQLPQFQNYSPFTALSGIYTIDQKYRPGYTQQSSFNLQSEFATDMALQIGYVGAHGEHDIEVVNPNQASLATSQSPIRGIRTTEVGNIGQRVRVLGFTPTGISVFQSKGESWYNSLQASLVKRGRQSEFHASYTFSKTLSTSGTNAEQAAEGFAVVGNQLDPRSRYGRTNFDRTHRFVLTYIYRFPSVERSRLSKLIMSGWEVGGVTTIQSGRALSITATNADNAYGITNNVAQLTGTCSSEHVVTAGSVGRKLNRYFNSDCFTSAYPVIGTDGLATSFGNGIVGIANGPDQNNSDVILIKHTKVPWPHDGADFEFRAEFFNAFNTPQFSNPGTTFGVTGFGQITATSVNPRIIQLAVKYSF